MVQKKLQPESSYNEYDLDGDGIVSDEELNTVKAIHEAESAMDLQRSEFQNEYQAAEDGLNRR